MAGRVRQWAQYAGTNLDMHRVLPLYRLRKTRHSIEPCRLAAQRRGTPGSWRSSLPPSFERCAVHCFLYLSLSSAVTDAEVLKRIFLTWDGSFQLGHKF